MGLTSPPDGRHPATDQIICAYPMLHNASLTLTGRSSRITILHRRHCSSEIEAIVAKVTITAVVEPHDISSRAGWQGHEGSFGRSLSVCDWGPGNDAGSCTTRDQTTLSLLPVRPGPSLEMSYLGCLAAFPMNGLHIILSIPGVLVSRDCRL